MGQVAEAHRQAWLFFWPLLPAATTMIQGLEHGTGFVGYGVASQQVFLGPT